MNKQPAKGTVEFEHVSKRYRLDTFGSLRNTVSALFSRNGNSNEGRRTIWALRDVSFRIAPGQSLGLIGPNGSGKTTTLKLLSNITKSTTGQITVTGRTSALIELGAGFHPELSGRENIYLNGAILGLRRHEITHKLDAIIAFAELERFIDMPVKRYSSGMYVRLGFAVAAHVEPDILLVDEVLAVGDSSFRVRCIEYMRKLRRQGTTVVFISHNMHLVRQTCDSVLLLAKGQICAEGEPSTVIAEYERLLRSRDSGLEAHDECNQTIFDSQGDLILTAVEITSSTQSRPRGLASCLPAKLCIYYKAGSPQEIGRIDIKVIRDDGTLCSTIDSVGTADPSLHLHKLSGNGVIEVSYEPLQLTTGKYFVLVQITDPGDGIIIASGQSNPFYVYEDYMLPGPGIYIPLVRWSKRTLES